LGQYRQTDRSVSPADQKPATKSSFPPQKPLP